MLKQHQKYKDPRTPVSVTQVGKFTVTIYDQAAYDESLRLYGDDSYDTKGGANPPVEPKEPRFNRNLRSASRDKPLFAQKKEARYNWISSDLAREMRGVAL